MKKAIGTILLWFLAVLITLFSALYQRWSGPTYPLKGKVMIDEEEIPFRLQRSEIVEKDAEISIGIPDTSISGSIQFRRYPSHDEWQFLPMIQEGESLKIFLPHQPPAGKLIYFVFLEKGEEKVSLSGEKPVVLRYKDDVPAAILLPHILLMFLVMLFSNRTGLEALNRRDNTHRLMRWTIALFFIGGFIYRHVRLDFGLVEKSKGPEQPGLDHLRGSSDAGHLPHPPQPSGFGTGSYQNANPINPDRVQNPVRVFEAI